MALAIETRSSRKVSARCPGKARLAGWVEKEDERDDVGLEKK
jgi:hypothetical protein